MYQSWLMFQCFQFGSPARITSFYCRLSFLKVPGSILLIYDSGLVHKLISRIHLMWYTSLAMFYLNVLMDEQGKPWLTSREFCVRVEKRRSEWKEVDGDNRDKEKKKGSYWLRREETFCKTNISSIFLFTTVRSTTKGKRNKQI